jgi:RNA polymerase sigma factor (TIGR02999 family)
MTVRLSRPPEVPSQPPEGEVHETDRTADRLTDRGMDAHDITRLLEVVGEGRDEALDEVFEVVYPRLREIARARRRGWQGAHTLNTTGLVHEAYLKVAGRGGYESRAHFFATTARAMRQVLINYAEKRSARKRGGAGAVEVTLHDDDAVTDQALEEILSLDDALRKLEALSERQAHVVECLFFAGLNVPETAEALDISPATVKRDWTTARAWLYREMSAPPPGSPDEAG